MSEPSVLKLLNTALVVFILHAVFFICLSQMYLLYVVTLFGYQGYEDNFSISKLCAAIFIILLSSTIVRRKGKASNFFLHMTITLIVIPSMVLYCCSDLPNEFALLTAISFIIMASVAGSVNMLTIKSKNIEHKKLVIILSSLSILFVVSLFAFGGGRFLNFDLSLVYDLRRDAANNLPEIYMYLSSLFSKVIIPFGIIFGLHNRNWLVVFILSSCSILVFALTANKAPLFYPAIIFLVYLIAEKRNIVSLFLLSAIVIIILSIIDFWLSMHSDNSMFMWFGSVIGRRAFLVPSELNWRYFDFFSTNPYYFWSQSKLSMGLVEQPYDLSPANLIGERISGSKDTNANTGWIGSGFANAGYIGAFVYSALIGLFFSFLDAYSRKLGIKIVIALFVLPVMTLITSTDLLTMIFTHGLFVAILLLIHIQPYAILQKSKTAIR